MAENDRHVYVLPEVTFSTPTRRRVRQQRRLTASALPDPDTIGADQPGPANDSGISEQDVRTQVQDAAQRAIPANPFGDVPDAQRALPPAAQVLGDAQRGSAGLQLEDEDDAEEAQTQARVDAAMSPLTPAQRTRVQSLPVVGDEDSAENARELIGASQRAQGMPQPMPTRLHTSQIDLGGGSLRAPSPVTPRPSMALRAPAVASPRIPPPRPRNEEQAQLIERALTELPPAGQERAFRLMPPEQDERRGIIIDALDEQEIRDRERAEANANADATEDEDIDTIGATDTPDAVAETRPLTVPERNARMTPRRGVDIAEDERDRTQAQRLQRAQRAIAILSAVPALFGGRSGGVSGAGIARIANGLNPQAPLDRIEQRANARAESAERQRTQSIEDDEREYRRALEERRNELENRRIAQAESATEARNRRTAAQYDVDSNDAAALRRAYEATIGNLSQDAARLLPGFITSQYGGDLDLSQQTASGMEYLIEQLNREIERQAELNPRAFRLGRHGGGGRARDPRGTLAGLGGGGGGGRGRDYGGPLGARDDDEGDASIEREPVDGGGTTPRRAVPSVRSSSAPNQAAVPQSRAVSPTAGRPLVDRAPTPEELEAMPPAERATAGLIRAFQRANPGTDYRDASAAVQILQPSERSRIMTDYGSDNAIEVPGWTRRDNVALDRRELIELRAQNAMTDRLLSASTRMERLADQIGPAELARGAFNADETLALARNISREMQAAMRQLQNMGVPNGPEMAMALEQAGEVRTPADLVRVRQTYRALRRWAAEANASRLRSYGFVRRRAR